MFPHSHRVLNKTGAARTASAALVATSLVMAPVVTPTVTPAVTPPDLGVLAPPVAAAASKSMSFAEFMSRDVLIASFFTSDADHTDSLYISFDGKNFDRIAVPYQDAFPGDPYNDTSTQGRIHHTLGDPSIMYHDGYFWMLSGMQRRDGRFWPMIGLSPDGRNWTYPEGVHFNGGRYNGIRMTPSPAGTDTVAPEWVQDRAGNVYIMFSAGYFGLFHGRPYQDRMKPYLVRVNQLRCEGFANNNPRLPKITFRAGPAQRFNLPVNNGADRIDGSAFADDNGTMLMTIKRDGAYNEIWRNTSMSTSGWRLVTKAAVIGSEGPSLTKLNGRYLLYTDKLATWGKDRSRGTLVASATRPEGPWSSNGKIVTRKGNGQRIANRHGSVNLLRSIEAKRKIYTLWTGRPAPGSAAGSLIDQIRDALRKLTQ